MSQRHQRQFILAQRCDYTYHYIVFTECCKSLRRCKFETEYGQFVSIVVGSTMWCYVAEYMDNEGNVQKAYSSIFTYRAWGGRAINDKLV